jgi:hypothetical protein
VRFENTLHSDRGVKGVRPLPIGKDSIKPRDGDCGSHCIGVRVKGVRPLSGGALKVSEIYKFIKNGYDWPDLKPISQWNVIKDLSSKFHQVYKNDKQKRIIINYTGSKGMADLLNNIDYLLQTYPLTPRFLKAKAVFDNGLKRFPKYKFTLVSHSQGGIITRELSRIYGNDIFEIIALNPGESEFVENIKSMFGEGKRTKEYEYNIKSELDFASYFAKKNKNDIIIPKESDSLIKEHKSEILLRLNPDLEIGRPLRRRRSHCVGIAAIA